MAMAGGGGTYNLGTASGVITVNASQLAAATGALSTLSKAFLGVGTLALVGFGMAVNAASDFEKQLARFDAVSDATGADMDAVREKALQLGQDSAFGASQVAEGFVEIAKAGLSAKDIIAGVGDAAVYLAAAGEMDMAQATEVLVNTMRTFGLEAKDAVDIANRLAGAANASTTEIVDLATSLRYVGPVAAAAGIDLNSTAQAMAVLGNAGIKGSTAGTSLRGILVQLSPTTEKAKNKMKELGIITEDGANKFFDAQGKAKSFADIAQILQDATKGLTKEQKIEAFTTLFQRRAMAAAIVMAEEGKKGFEELASSNQYATTAQEVMETKLDTLSGSLMKLKASLETAGIEIGTAFLPMIKTVTDFIKNLTNAFIDLPGPVKSAVGWFLLISGTLLVFIGSAGFVAKQVIAIYRAFVLLRGATFLPGLINSIGTAFRLLSVSLLTNPIFLVIAALVLLGVAFYLLYTKVEGFRDFIDETWQVIQDFWDDVLGAFQGFLNWLEGVGDWLYRNIVEPWNRAYEYLVGHSLIPDLINRIVWLFGTLPVRIAGALLSLARKFGEAFGGLVVAAARGLADVTSTLVGWGVSAVQWAIDFGVEMTTSFVEWLTELPGTILEFFTQIAEQLATWGEELLTWVVDTGTRATSNFINWLSRLPGTFYQWFLQVWRTVVSVGQQIVQAAYNFAAGIFNSIYSWLVRLPGMVWGFITQVLSVLGNAAGAAISTARRIGQGIWDGIVGALGGLASAVWGVLNNVVSTIGNFAGNAWSAAQSVGSSIWNGFRSGIGLSSPSYLERAMVQIVKNVEAGVESIDTSIQRVSGMTATLAGMRVNTAVTGTAATGLLRAPPVVAPPPRPERTAPVIGEIVINNPVPEPAEESLYRVGQKVAYLGLAEVS